MKKWVFIFLLLRIVMYVVISLSYVKHGISLWVLLLLYMIIELNVWITYFFKKKESIKLLKELEKNLKK